MQWEDLEISAPKNGFVTIKHSYIGINYIEHIIGLGFILAASQMEGLSNHRSWSDTELKEGDKVIYTNPPEVILILEIF